MRVGAVYPQIELGGDPGAVKAFAQAAEGLGYDHLILYDHVVGVQHADRDPPLTGPYDDQDPFHEVFTTFAYLAGITERIELTTGVLVLPQRQTALVAKQAADIDLFSGGRLRLGVGVGWNWVEFEALEMGDAFRRRGRREAAQIELLRQFWQAPLISHSDPFHRVERASIAPRPGRQIPIWIGGFSDRTFERAAQIGDGFLFSASRQSEAVTMKPKLDALLRAQGRSPEAFGTESMQHFKRGPGAWAGDIKAWQAVDGTHISVVTMQAGLGSVDAHIRAIDDWLKAYQDCVA